MRKGGAAGYRDSASRVEIFGCLAFFAVCAAMAWIAFTEGRISSASPRTGQVFHFTGRGALHFGAVMLFTALAALGGLCRYMRLRRLCWPVLVLSWLGLCLWGYFSA